MAFIANVCFVHRFPAEKHNCDTLCGRTADICSLQPFLWRRIKTCAFLDLCACAGAAARDRVGEVYLAKHPQVHGIQIHSRAIKAHFQDVRRGRRNERGGWKSPWLHTDRAWPEKRETRLSKMKGWQSWSQMSLQVFSAWRTEMSQRDVCSSG